MTIQIACKCGNVMNVADMMAGTQGNCPRCGVPFNVPKPGALKPGAPKAGASKAEAPKPAAAPVVLEMEDFKETAKPKDAGLPLLDAAAPPSPASGKGVSKAPASKKGKLAPAGPGPGELQCPKCRVNYPDHMPFCVTCSIDLKTGLPVVGGLLTGHLKKSTNYKAPVDWEEDMPFWKVCAGMIYKPHKTLGTFVYLFERQDMLAKMVVFYVISFVFVALGAGNIGRTIKEKIHDPDAEARIDAQVSDFKEERATNWLTIGKDGGMHGTNLGPPFAYKIAAPEEGIQAGGEFDLAISLAEPGPGKGVDADVWVIETYQAGKERELGADWVQTRPVGQLGDYSIRLRAKISDGTSWLVQVYAKGVHPEAEEAQWRGGFHVALKSKPGWARKVKELEASGGDEYGRTDAQIISAMERTKVKRNAPVEFKTETPEGPTSKGKPWLWKVHSPAGEVQMEQPFTFAIEVKEPADPNSTEPAPPWEVDVEVELASSDFGEKEIVGPDIPQDRLPVFARWENNQYIVDVPRASVASSTYLSVKIHEKNQDRAARGYLPRGRVWVVLPTAAGWGAKAYEKEKARKEQERKDFAEASGIGPYVVEPAVPAPVKKALQGAMRVVAPILQNIIGVICSAALFTVAARMLGGGGSFLLCLIAVGFLSGFGNFLQLGLMFTKETDAFWIGYIFFAWTFILRLMALMKVFDIDFMGAFLTNAIAGVLELYVLSLIAVALLGKAAVMS